jgi:hypothetical protein
LRRLKTDKRCTGLLSAAVWSYCCVVVSTPVCL